MRQLCLEQHLNHCLPDSTNACAWGSLQAFVMPQHRAPATYHAAALVHVTISLAAHMTCSSSMQAAIGCHLWHQSHRQQQDSVTHPALLLLCAGGSNGVFSHQAVLALAGLVSAAVGSYKNWNT